MTRESKGADDGAGQGRPGESNMETLGRISLTYNLKISHGDGLFSAEVARAGFAFIATHKSSIVALDVLIAAVRAFEAAEAKAGN